MKTTKQNGFTLYELLITVVIIGIILSLGIPNFMDFTANSRITATANDIHASFHMARSEAARAKTNVTICASANSMDAGANCGGTFADGWIVFQDTNGDINRDAGETILRAHPAPSDRLSISTPGMGQYFGFAGTGLGRGNVTGQPPVTTAVICDDRGNITAAGGLSAGRAVVITPLGRATVIREVADVQAIINNVGAACP